MVFHLFRLKKDKNKKYPIECKSIDHIVGIKNHGTLIWRIGFSHEALMYKSCADDIPEVPSLDNRTELMVPLTDFSVYLQIVDYCIFGDMSCRWAVFHRHNMSPYGISHWFCPYLSCSIALNPRMWKLRSLRDSACILRQAHAWTQFCCWDCGTYRNISDIVLPLPNSVRHSNVLWAILGSGRHACILWVVYRRDRSRLSSLSRYGNSTGRWLCLDWCRRPASIPAYPDYRELTTIEPRPWEPLQR